MQEDEVKVHFRPLNCELLDSQMFMDFDIYYKEKTGGSAEFIKFAGRDPKHMDKVRRLLENGELEGRLFVREDEIMKYFQHATETLRNFVANETIPIEEKLKKVQNVSRDIMKQFFEYQATDTVLRAADEVVELMGTCLEDPKVGFHGLSELLGKDYYTYTHSVNVGLYCMTYGVKSGMNPTDVREIGLGGILHDVGKSRVPEKILNKKGKLSETEFREMKKHSQYGVDILQSMGCYGMNVVCMAGQHHEKYDGSGYPAKLQGDDIAYFARICKTMDVYDALTTRRSYKRPQTPLEALSIMKREMSHEFDSKILDSFIRMLGPKG